MADDGKLAFEDFPVGAVATFGDYEVMEDEIVAFAAQFDPQPIHLDDDAAQNSLLGGLAASGWHTCAMTMRMICDGFLLSTHSLGSPGVKEVRWRQPVRPGDRLSIERTCVSARPSKSRPDTGLCVLRYDVKTQTGAVVMTMEATHIFARREAAQ